MKSISLLIKPSSGACNIDCVYCFYKDLIKGKSVSKDTFMSYKTVDTLIINVFKSLDDGDFVEFSFQGGEPTLMGLEFFEYFVKKINEINRPLVKVNYSFQTNGIFIDEHWCSFFLKNKFLVGLSIDGPLEINDRYRRQSNGSGTFDYILKTKNLFDAYNVEYNILSVLTKHAAKEPEKIWKFIINNDISFIQFIPCIDDFNKKSTSEFALEPRSFAEFYKVIFELWFTEFKRGNYISISFIDQIINLIANNNGVSCAILGKCSPQYVVESDGSVYPCDFYVLENLFCGKITDNTLKDIFNSNSMVTFLQEEKPQGVYCNSCRYFSLCNGGCKRFKKTIYEDTDDKFCGLRSFLEEKIDDIEYIIDSFM